MFLGFNEIQCQVKLNGQEISSSAIWIMFVRVFSLILVQSIYWKWGLQSATNHYRKVTLQCLKSVFANYVLVFVFVSENDWIILHWKRLCQKDLGSEECTPSVPVPIPFISFSKFSLPADIWAS